MSQPINLAIVGTGIFATDNHLPTIQKIPIETICCLQQNQIKG